MEHVRCSAHISLLILEPMLKVRPLAARLVGVSLSQQPRFYHTIKSVFCMSNPRAAAAAEKYSQLHKHTTLDFFSSFSCCFFKCNIKLRISRKSRKKEKKVDYELLSRIWESDNALQKMFTTWKNSQPLSTIIGRNWNYVANFSYVDSA